MVPEPSRRRVNALFRQVGIRRGRGHASSPSRRGGADARRARDVHGGCVHVDGGCEGVRLDVRFTWCPPLGLVENELNVLPAQKW